MRALIGRGPRYGVARHSALLVVFSDISVRTDREPASVGRGRAAPCLPVPTSGIVVDVMLLIRRLVWFCLATLPLIANAGVRPHVVVFLADDHGYLDSEVYGSKDVRTPHMRRIAAAGMTFTHCFVASPSCAPSRAALLTGLMPARNGAEPNHAKPKPDIKKLPAYLQELGYEVAAFGKVSHYKHTSDYGFNYFAHDGFHDAEAIPTAVRWLRDRESDKPLCLFVGSNWPHVPWPEESEGYDPGRLGAHAGQIETAEMRLALALYYSAVTRMDAELGAIFDVAREKLGTNVLFLQSSDHGAQFPFGKWNCYDAGIRTSLIAVWPGVIEAASQTSAMASWVDILPTIVEAAGGKPPQGIDGRSFLEVLRGGTEAHRDVVFATHSGDGNMNVYPMRAIRSADWKYILNLHPEYAYHTHIDLAEREGKQARWGGYWKSWIEAGTTNPGAEEIVRRYHRRPAEELYDLRADPLEQNNLAVEPEHAARMREFRQRLESWMKQQGDSKAVFGKPRLLKP